MTRKDTILVAVVVNAGLLAVLFGAAIIHDPEEGGMEPTTQIAFVEKPAEKPPISSALLDPPTMAPVESNWEIPSSSETKESTIAPPPAEGEKETSAWVTVTVKKGDVLEKIAKAHGVSVAAIKKYNQLSSEKLSIGQTLKVPVKKKEESASVLPEEDKGAVYYTLKSGDSPWKIAKMHQMTVDELLRLNHLDEEKAKNLQIGDRVRVK